MNENAKLVTVTVQVPADRAAEFERMYMRFMVDDQAAEIRRRAAEDRDQGVASLSRLVEVARGASGQCRYIARFLAALYNGPRFRFDATDLRAIDDELFEHCMAVLRLDHRCEREVHDYFPDGSRVWEQGLIEGWSLDVEQLGYAVDRVVAAALDKPADHRLAELLRKRFPSEGEGNGG